MSSSTEQAFHIKVGEKSDRGCKRDYNEDSHVTFSTMVLQRYDRSDIVQAQVAVVADGIGGTEGGKKASTIAVNTIKSIVDAHALTTPVSNLLEPAIIRANENINDARKNNEKFYNMGTTVVAAIIAHNVLYISHAGDSRAYLIRKGNIHLLTVDHTWVQEALAEGQLTPKEAARHPNKNVVKRYLGTDEILIVDNQMIDLTRSTKVNPQSDMIPRLILQPGDVVILCTDGLTDLVTDREILRAVQKQQNNPQNIADKLIDLANEKGGTDNITVVVMAWQDDSKAAMLPIVAKLILGLALVLIFIAVAISSPISGNDASAGSSTATTSAEQTTSQSSSTSEQEKGKGKGTTETEILAQEAGGPTSTPILTFTPVSTNSPEPEQSATKGPSATNPPSNELVGSSASSTPETKTVPLPSSIPSHPNTEDPNQPSATATSTISPPPTSTTTTTPSPTSTTTPSPTGTPTPSPTGTTTPSPTGTPTPSPTGTPTPSPTGTPTPSPTSTTSPSPTGTTNTPFVPTNTPFVPTNTPFVPTNTPFVPTNTPFVPTNTPFVPTNTPSPKPEPTQQITITFLSPDKDKPVKANEVIFEVKVNGIVNSDDLLLRASLDQQTWFKERNLLWNPEETGTYSTSIDYRPGGGSFGKDYYWRVDVVTADGTVFSSEVRKFRWEDPNSGQDGSSKGPGNNGKRIDNNPNP